MGAKERLKELREAANEYFAKEKTRLRAEYEFLDSISRARGGNIGLQNANAEGASAILVDSINEYLGRPIQVSGS